MSPLLWLGIRGQIGKRRQNRGHSPYRHGKLEINSLPLQREPDSWPVEGKHQYSETLSMPSSSSSTKWRPKPISPREALARWQEPIPPSSCRIPQGRGAGTRLRFFRHLGPRGRGQCWLHALQCKLHEESILWKFELFVHCCILNT